MMIVQGHAHPTGAREAGVEAGEHELVIPPEEDSSDQHERHAEEQNVALVDEDEVSEEERFEAHVTDLLYHLHEHRTKPQREREEHSDHGVAGQSGAVSHVDHSSPDEDSEPHHHEGHEPRPECRAFAGVGRLQRGGENAQRDTGECAVGHRVAKERHPVADDKRADHPAEQAHDGECQNALDHVQTGAEQVGELLKYVGHPDVGHREPHGRGYVR
jgi:hypothetical protein